MSILWVINDILLVIILAIVFNELRLRIMVKRSAKVLTEEGSKETMRKAQAIDIREKDIFDAEHILGARGMPYGILRAAIGPLRGDQPVYLYNQKRVLSIQITNLLRKNGYTGIHILKGGCNDWTGRVKKRDN